MRPQERVISLAEDQVGYLYKKSNAQLDDFKANAGGKWNKFARDLDALGDFYNGKKNGYDGCDVFVDWLFVKTFGREVGQRMLKDVPASYQPTIRKLMERGWLKGVADPDPNSLEDNVLNLDETYCRVMTTLDKAGKL